MPGQIAIIASANSGNLVGRFVQVSYPSSSGGSEMRFGQVISLGHGPRGNNITMDTQKGPRTLPLPNMETSAKFMTEHEFRTMFPNWKQYEPK